MKPYGLQDLYACALERGPFPYQEKLGAEPIGNRALILPTGAGKTAAAIFSWIHQLDVNPASTPKRLVYCLPMRSLVEQTRKRIDKWRERTGRAGDIAAYTLMGGEVDENWELEPERPCIIVATQDMALSRALNRGYAMSRYRWPVHFAMLNNDCFWVIDEVQLFGSALATSTQLQAFRESWGTVGAAATWWMSATMDKNWLATVDFAQSVGDLPVTKLEVADFEDGELDARYHARKPVERLRRFDAQSILDAHRPGTLTLLVVNTVGRAHAKYAELQEVVAKPRSRKGAAPAPEFLLLHSRFRAPDRKTNYDLLRLADLLLRGKEPEDGTSRDPAWEAHIRERGLICVATQVVEAGLDISAETLITEITPWPNLVQRFGRCNRFGTQKDARILIWADLRKDELPPYSEQGFDEARERLTMLIQKGASPKTLDGFDPPSQPRPAHVIRRHDLAGLFSTEPDLAGGFTDVSRFVRDVEGEYSVYVFWRRFQDTPESQPRAAAEEICSVPVNELKDLLGSESAWEWNGEARRWERRSPNDIHPGMTLLLAQEAGGYSQGVGWTGNPQDLPVVDDAAGQEPDSQGSDPSSTTDRWVTLDKHLSNVADMASHMLPNVPITAQETAAIHLAIRWHDVGKAHKRWQEAALKAGGSPPSPNTLWAKFPGKPGTFRPNLRHEAASALAAWSKWQEGEPGWTALAVYLTAAHHGKVRTFLRCRTNIHGQLGEDVFGVREGDTLELAGYLEPPMTLDLSPRSLGGTGSWENGGYVLKVPGWIEVIADLLGEEADPGVLAATEPKGLGPFRLAMLEALVVAADARASRKEKKGE